MKSVLLSIQPKWCELIASGEKTVEIRKTKPKIETPLKCYIYCTLKDCKEFFKDTLGGDVAKWNKGKWADKKGKVIGEFICEHITNIEVLHKGLFTGGYPNGNCTSVVERSALTAKDIKEYANGKKEVYGWHISDLVIYDKPKELSEFATKQIKNTISVENNIEGIVNYPKKEMIFKKLTKPPQSWCYVEEEMEK